MPRLLEGTAHFEAGDLATTAAHALAASEAGRRRRATLACHNLGLFVAAAGRRVRLVFDWPLSMVACQWGLLYILEIKGWEASRRLLTPVGAHQGPVVLSTG